MTTDTNTKAPNSVRHLPSFAQTLRDEADKCDLFGITRPAELLRDAAAIIAEAQTDHIPGAGKMVQSVAAPQGWKLVPVEPTVGMCIAGDEARANVDDLTRTPAIYRAMLAAAPAAPAPALVPPDLDVRKIMIRVVPGDDGMGHEVFARDVGDVQRLLSETFERLADLESNLPDPPATAHPDDEAVDRFASMLTAKLAKAREKGRSGWADPEWPAADINRQLHKHAAKGDPLDVAAYAMFLALRGEATTAAPAPAPLTAEKVGELLMEAGYMGAGSDGTRARGDFINGLRHGEVAHGIGSKA